MSSPTTSDKSPAPMDFSKWRVLPIVLIVIGGVMSLVGAFTNYKQFTFSWLLAFMFFLSIGIAGLCLTMLHHLFDAAWSVPIRRIYEQLSCLLFPWLAILFIPIVLNVAFAQGDNNIYEWVKMLKAHEADHSIKAKFPLFTITSFYVVTALCFLLWAWLAYGLRGASLAQDRTGDARLTHKMRFYSGLGIFIFAITVTLGAIMWMKSLFHEWFSTMYPVYYFAGSVWLTLATVYTITALLQRQGPLRGFVHEKTYYFLGTLFFAFTVFYAYVTFAQYFIQWNANVPEEIFWFKIRERGSWYYVGILMIFGHFFVPFLTLLRIDVKLKLTVMLPMAIWAWMMHFMDTSFNIMPALHPEGFVLHWMDLGTMAFFGGLLAFIFVKNLYKHPVLPQQDPRFAESQDLLVLPDEYVEAATARGINHHNNRGGQK
jgi:hypothetical protein